MKIRGIAILAFSGVVVGCSDLADDLGLGKQSPDEFQVVRRAPLSVPPSLALRPPRSRDVAESRATRESQVRETLFSGGEAGGGRGSSASGPIMTLNFNADGDATVVGGGSGGFAAFGPSDGEIALLARAGADRASSSIRGVVDAESNERVIEDAYLLDRILFWREADRGDRVVDAAAESARIRADAAAGRQTTGDGAATRAATSSSSSAGLLDGIF